MPRAGDLSLLGSVGLPMDRNPLQRISYQPAKSVFDLDALLEQVETFVVDFLFPAIEELTGIDLSAFLPILDGTIGALTTLFGELNPTSGTFNPLDAVTTFIELMVEVGANLPLALISELAGFTGGVPILSQLIGLFTGTTGGLTGLSGLGSIFGDLTGLLGNPTALGSGTPILGSAGSIPLLGPLIEEFVSLLGGVGAGSGLGGLTTIFEDLLGVLGNPTGLGSGTPGIGSLGSIPLLGPVFGLFGGATSATQAGNFFTNLLSFLGTPTLTGSTGTFDPTSAATSFINDILNPTGLLASVSAIVEALTGTSGDLTDLTAWATDIPIIGDIVEAITGLVGGDLTDLFNFNVLGGGSPLDALNIFGNLPTNLFGLIPTSSLGTTSPNLLDNPIFATAASLLGETQWSWDGTQTHAPTGGSALAVADGTNKDLLSNAVPVVAGQQVPMSAWTKWSGLTSTGSPISLGVTGFLDGTEVASSTLASVASPGASGGWSQLTGTYTAPSGVDEIRMRLHVGDTATAGNVWFDDGSITKNVGTDLFPQSAITGLVGQFLDIFDIFGGATNLGQANNFITNLLALFNNPTLTGSTGSFNPSTVLSSMITGLINPLGLLAPLSGGTVPTTNIPTLPDTKVPGLGSWVDTIFNSLTGQGLAGVFQADAGGQIAELAGTVSSLGAAVANLINLGDAASNSGLRGLDDLERTSSTDLGSTLWAQTYSGGASGLWATPTGHSAKWVPGSGVRTAFARRTNPDDAVTQTDYQKVGMTIGSQIITQNGFFSSSPNVENSIILRQSADGSQYVRARIKNDQAQFFYKNGGAETPLGSSVSTSHAAGVNFYGVAGTAGNIRTFQLIRNTSPILTVTDNSNVTALGTSNRNWGATATADSGDVPSEVAQFTVADNTPVAVTGTTMRVYRGTTTGITKSAGEGALPANTFDTVDYISTDMTWNASTSTLTVTKAGTYLFSGRFEMSNAIGFSEELYPIVQVGGVTRARGGARRGITAAAFGVPHFPQDKSAGGDAMMLYLQANATVRFGFSATASNTVIGDASGHKTWFAATKIS